MTRTVFVFKVTAMVEVPMEIADASREAFAEAHDNAKKLALKKNVDPARAICCSWHKEASP